MTKLLSLIILSMLFSFSVQAKEYNSAEVKRCEPLDYTVNRFCDLNNVLVTGKIKSYHENGNLKAEINYKNGKAEGLAKAYYPNGNLESEGNYKDDKLEGLKKVYYENGNLQAEINYKNGKAEGLARAYYENGNLQEEVNFKDGKEEGVAKVYHENGSLKSEINYKDGKAVSGYMYDIYGKRTKMTNAHLHNLTKDLPKAD